MSDGIVKVKNSINSTEYLYGCDVNELPVSKEDRILMHEAQANRAKELGEKIYDRMGELGKRLKKVNESQNWNRMIVDELKKGK